MGPLDVPINVFIFNFEQVFAFQSFDDLETRILRSLIPITP